MDIGGPIKEFSPRAYPSMVNKIRPSPLIEVIEVRIFSRMFRSIVVVIF
jgi:hypothetical protein